MDHDLGLQRVNARWLGLLGLIALVWPAPSCLVEITECDENVPCTSGHCFRGFCKADCLPDDPGCQGDRLCRPCKKNTDNQCTSDSGRTAEATQVCVECLCNPVCNAEDKQICVDGECLVAEACADDINRLCLGNVRLEPLDNKRVCRDTFFVDPCVNVTDECACPARCPADQICADGLCQTPTPCPDDASISCVGLVVLDALANRRICKGKLYTERCD